MTATQRVLTRRGALRCAFRLTLLMCVLIVGPARWIASLPAAEPRSEAEASAQYFEGLRKRGLYSLAESICLRRLADVNLPATRRAEYSIELSRCFTQHASRADSDDEQQELFTRARDAVEQTLARPDALPQRLLLRAQSLLVVSSQIELLRWRWELEPEDALRKRAQVLIEGAVPQFEELSSAVFSELKKTARTSDQVLTSNQLRSVDRHLKFALAQIWLDQARMTAPASPDRADALNKAHDVLLRLAGGIPGEAMTWRSQLALITVTRLKGEYPVAARMIDAIKQDQPPPDVLDELIAEQAELLIVEQKLPEASDLLRQRRVEQRRLTGRQSALLVDALVKLSAIARDRKAAQLADELVEEASLLTERAAVDTPGYWTLRCRQTLENSRLAAKYGGSSAPLMKRAQQSLADGKFDEAVAEFMNAYRAAQADRQDDAAFEAARTAAALLVQQQRFSEATTLLDEVLSGNLSLPRKAELDFLRAVVLGLGFQQQPATETREQYTAALMTHREKYPTATSAGEAAWLLAQLEEHRLQASAAIKLYAAIPESHPRFLPAKVAIARCGETILLRLKATGAPATEWEDALVDLLLPQLRALLQAEPQSELHEEQTELLVRATRLLLMKTTPDYVSADRLLDRVIQSAAPSTPLKDGVTSDNRADSRSSEGASSPLATSQQTAAAAAHIHEWKQAAIGLRIVSLAARGQMNDARQLLESAPKDAATLLSVSDGLTKAAELVGPDVRQQLGELQLGVLERIRPLISKARQSDLLKVEMSASQLAGHDQRAAEIAEQLLLTTPRDQALLKQAAKLRSKSTDPAHQELARQHWLRLETQLKPGSSTWFDTRLHVIEATLACGKKDEARKLMKVTRLLYPVPAEPNLHAAFNKLAAQLGE